LTASPPAPTIKTAHITPAPRRTDAVSPTPNQKPFEQRLHHAAARAEEELHRLVRYLDDEVVPEVRRNSSTALRAAAVRLQKLAESMDDAGNSSNSSDQPKDSGSPSGSDSQR
jgi:hypothetical protein